MIWILSYCTTSQPRAAKKSAPRRRLARRARPQMDQGCESRRTRMRAQTGDSSARRRPSGLGLHRDYHRLPVAAVRIAQRGSRQTGAWAPGVSPGHSALPCPALNHKHAEPRRRGVRSRLARLAPQAATPINALARPASNAPKRLKRLNPGTSYVWGGQGLLASLSAQLGSVEDLRVAATSRVQTRRSGSFFFSFLGLGSRGPGELTAGGRKIADP